MSFIKTISLKDAEGRLASLYARIKGSNGHIDNIMAAHSLRPASLEGHMGLYKNVLHHSANSVPKWLLETLGVYVSLLNECDYCVDHHLAGLRRLLKDDAAAEAIRATLEAACDGARPVADKLEAREIAALDYAALLTRTPANIAKGDIEALSRAGWDDGEILEINQVTAYFAYANRTVLGLGVRTDGEPLGLSPGNADSETDWGHQ